MVFIQQLQQQLTQFWHNVRHPDPVQLRHQLKQGAFIVAIFLVAYVIGSVIPIQENDFGFGSDWRFGFDWRNFFGIGIVPGFFLPWTLEITNRLNYPALFAFSVLALILRAQRYQASPLTLAMIFLSLPTFWVLLFLGNIDGLAILGLVLLPLGVPLVLLKPQVASFALLANRRSFIAAILWGLLSLILWGFWPLRFLIIINDPNWAADWPIEITLFPWGALLALPLMWYSRGDEDLLMAAGSLMTPHLFPYHFIVLLPSLARMSSRWRWLTWLVVSAPILYDWLGPLVWRFGNVASLCFWFGIYLAQKNLKQNNSPIPHNTRTA